MREEDIYQSLKRFRRAMGLAPETVEKQPELLTALNVSTPEAFIAIVKEDLERISDPLVREATKVTIRAVEEEEYKSLRKMRERQELYFDKSKVPV